MKPQSEEITKKLQALIAEAEKLLGQGSESQEHSETESLAQRAAHLKEQLAELCCRGKEQVCSCAKKTDTAVRAHPYESIAVALGLGLLLGVILKGRKVE